MLRNLLVSTALAGVLATSAYAQDANTTSDPASTQPAATDTQSTDSQSMDMASNQSGGDYLENLSSDQFLASDLTGLDLYDGEGEDAAQLGSIDNYLVDSDGEVVAAIVSVTGAEETRTVAVPYEDINWTMTPENEPRASVSASAEELASMPSFMSREEQQAAMSADPAAAPTAGGDPAAGGTGMAAGDSAMTDPAAGGTGMAASGNAATDPAAGGTGMAASNDSGVATGGQGSTQDMASTSTSGSSDAPTSVGDNQFLSENLIGANVYSGPGEDADNIGSINDLVVTSDGSVEAAVIGVGGFLGIGQKDVAAPFDMVEVDRDDSDQPRFIFASDREELDQAPSFSGERQDQMAEGDTSGTATEQTGDMAAASGAAAGAAAGCATNQVAQAGDQTATSGEQSMDGAAQDTTGVATGGATDGTQSDSTTTASTGGERPADLQPVGEEEQLTADDMMGTTVYGPNNESVGSIGDIALSQDGGIDAVIVDVGGFLGIGQKPVAVAVDNLDFMRDSSGSLYLYTQFTEEQLESAPEYNADTYAENRDEMRIESESDVAN